jgi:hypothetical protein
MWSILWLDKAVRIVECRIHAMNEEQKGRLAYHEAAVTA